MTYLNEFIGQGLPSYLIYILIFALGIILMVQGTRLFRLFFTVSGLLIGYQFGIGLANTFNLEGTAMWVLSIAFALLTAAFLGFALKASFAVAGALFGAYLAWYLTELFAWPIPAFILFIVAIISGIISAKLRFSFIRLASSVIGALLVGDAVIGWWKDQRPLSVFWQTIDAWQNGERIILLLLLIGGSVLGFLTQNRRRT